MRPRILIVDDETNVRLNYRVTLETEGYEVFEAASAAVALEELLQRSFAVAILDMRMPGDGRSGVAGEDAGGRNHGAGDDCHSLQRRAARGESDEAGGDRLFAETSPA